MKKAMTLALLLVFTLLANAQMLNLFHRTRC